MYTATNIADAEQILAFCTEMQATIESHYDADNGNAVVDRMNLLEQYMATSGKMLADAKYLHRRRVQACIDELGHRKSSLSPSIFNKYIDAHCRDLAHLVDWCDRLNAASVHQIDACRSVLSTRREEMRMNNYGR